MFIILDYFICNSLQYNTICTNVHIKQFSYVLDIIDCMNIQYLNCSEVIVITISHVHRIELFRISHFYHISFIEFTHKQTVITVHPHAIWITQITFINETEKLSICVKDVNTMVIPIFSLYTTLIVCCDTVVESLDPSY